MGVLYVPGIGLRGESIVPNRPGYNNNAHSALVGKTR